jgi:hypothetical protein
VSLLGADAILYDWTKNVAIESSGPSNRADGGTDPRSNSPRRQGSRRDAWGSYLSSLRGGYGYHSTGRALARVIKTRLVLQCLEVGCGPAVADGCVYPPGVAATLCGADGSSGRRT